VLEKEGTEARLQAEGIPQVKEYTNDCQTNERRTFRKREVRKGKTSVLKGCPPGNEVLGGKIFIGESIEVRNRPYPPRIENKEDDIMAEVQNRNEVLNGAS